MSDSAASATAISTNVPRSGRARRALFEPGDNCHDPLYAFGHVMRRQGGAGNIANVAAHLQRTGAGLAGKLRQPARTSDLAAIGLTILQNLHSTNPPGRIQRHCVVDIEMLSDNAIEDKEADKPSSGFSSPDSAGLHFGEARGRKGLFLRFGDREGLNSVRGRAGRHDDHSRHGPADPFRHASPALKTMSARAKNCSRLPKADSFIEACMSASEEESDAAEDRVPPRAERVIVLHLLIG